MTKEHGEPEPMTEQEWNAFVLSTHERAADMKAGRPMRDLVIPSRFRVILTKEKRRR